MFSKLFGDGKVMFDDLCETKQVTQGAIYLDFDAVHKPAFDYQGRHFVGRTGRFVPVTEASGGGLLLRVKDDKSYAVSGTKGYFWIEAEVAKVMDSSQLEIDYSYFDKLVDDAVKALSNFGDVDDFIAGRFDPFKSKE